MKSKILWLTIALFVGISTLTVAFKIANLKSYIYSFQEAYAKQPQKSKEEPSQPITPNPSSQEQPKQSTSEYEAYLEKREKELRERERALEEKEALLKSLQKDIEEKLSRLEEINKNIEAFKKEQERLQSEKIDTLVKIYTNMKPKDASKLLEKLDDELVVDIVSRMTTEQAAKIISSMEPKRAAQITEKLSKVKKLQ